MSDAWEEFFVKLYTLKRTPDIVIIELIDKHAIIYIYIYLIL